MEKLNCPLFVVGMPRSGTTLLTNLINASDEIYIGGESHFYPIKYQWEKKSTYLSGNVYQFAKFYFSHRNFKKHLDFEESTIHSMLLETQNFTSFSEFLNLICSYSSFKRNVQRWGEKSPMHFKYLDEILTDFPDTKIINIFRDPRDVFDSIEKVNWNTNLSNPYYFCVVFCQNMKIVDLYKDNPNYSIVKYEDLVSNSSNHLPDIFKFINIKYDDSILYKFTQEQYLNFNVAKEPWKKQNSRLIDKNNIFKWKKNYSDSNSNTYKYISWKLSKHLSNLNYEGMEKEYILFYVLDFKFKFKYFFKVLINNIFK